MHSFARHRHSRSEEASTKETKGLILKGGWRYDLMGWFCDTFLFRGQWRELRQRTANLAHVLPREQSLGLCPLLFTINEPTARYGHRGQPISNGGSK